MQNRSILAKSSDFDETVSYSLALPSPAQRRDFVTKKLSLKISDGEYIVLYYSVDVEEADQTESQDYHPNNDGDNYGDHNGDDAESVSEEQSAQGKSETASVNSNNSASNRSNGTFQTSDMGSELSSSIMNFENETSEYGYIQSSPSDVGSLDFSVADLDNSTWRGGTMDSMESNSIATTSKSKRSRGRASRM